MKWLRRVWTRTEKQCVCERAKDLDWDKLDRLAAIAWPEECACLVQVDANGEVVINQRCEEHAHG